MKKAAISLGVFGLCLFLVGTVAQIYTPGTGGPGGSGGGLTNGYSFDSAAFRTANDTNVFLKDGINLTNPVVSGSLVTSGGNTRGATAIDLQIGRAGATRVASGNYSVIPGGSNNMASGEYSFAGGYNSTAAGLGTFAYGASTLATNDYSVAFGWDNFVYSERSFVAAGTDNVIEHWGAGASASQDSVILGGTQNTVSNAPLAGVFGSSGILVVGQQGYALGAETSVVSNTLAGVIGGAENRSLGAGGLVVGSYNTNTGYRAKVVGNSIDNTESYAIKLGHGDQAAVLQSNGVFTIPRVRLTNATASRALVLGPDGIATNAAGTPDGTKFLRDDNTYAVPTAVASSNYVVLSAGDIDGTNKVAFNTVVANQYLHAAVITNHTAEPLAAGSGVLRIEGSNQFYFVNVLSNITINSGTSVLLQSNVTYGVWLTNTTYTVATEATWQWRNTKSVSTALSFQNGAYFLRLKRDFMGTNAWVEVEPNNELGAGSNVYFTTNSGVVTIQVPTIVTNTTALKWNVWTNYVQTVSNFVFSFNTNRVELKNQTNVVFTNIVEEATAVGADMAVHIHNTTGVTMGLVWPAYGAQHGYFFQTNINNPILTSTTLTTGKHGVASFTAFGTNIFATWSEWP